MDTLRSAEIIAFPRRSPGADTEDPALRLRRALAALDAAVAQQRAAVAAWRGTLGGLDGTMRGLLAALVGCEAQFGALRGRVDAATADARALAAWADAALLVAQEK